MFPKSTPCSRAAGAKMTRLALSATGAGTKVISAPARPLGSTWWSFPSAGSLVTTAFSAAALNSTPVRDRRMASSSSVVTLSMIGTVELIADGLPATGTSLSETRFMTLLSVCRVATSLKRK